MSKLASADVRTHLRRLPRRPSPTVQARLRRYLPALVLGVAIAGSTAMAAYFARDLWFSGDDWDYLLHRGTATGTDAGLWAPHYGHWSTGVVVVYRLLFAVVGLQSYLPYVAVCWALHAAIVVVSYLLLRRLGTGRGVALLLCWLLAFLGAGAEALLWDAVLNLLASLALGLTALLVLVVSGYHPRSRLACWLLLVTGLMFSGVGITMLAVVCTFAALRFSLRAAIAIGILPSAAYAVWWGLVGHTERATNVDGASAYLDAPEFLWTGLTYPFEVLSAIPGTGGLLLLTLLALPALARDVPEPLRLLAWAGVVGALFQMLLTTLTRVSGGTDWATTGRYGYLTVVLLAPSAALGLTWLQAHLRGPRLVPAAVVTVLVAAYTFNTASLMHDYTREHESFNGAWRDRLPGLVAAAEDGQRVLTDQMEPTLNPFLRASLVLTPEVRSAVRDDATAQGRVDAENLAMVAVGPVSHDLAVPATVRLVAGFAEAVEVEAGCHAHATAGFDNPTLELDTGATGNEIIVRSPAESVRTHLVRDDVESVARDWRVEPDTDVRVATTAQDATLRIILDRPGTVTICRN